MAEHDEEDVIAVPTDTNKRKHDDLSHLPPLIADDDSEAKRPRFDDVLGIYILLVCYELSILQ